MTSVASTIIVIVGILAVAGLGFTGYYYTPGSTTTPTPSSTLTPTPTPELNSPTPAQASPSPTFYPVQSSQKVQGVSTNQPSPSAKKLPSPTPTHHPTPTPVQSSNDLSIAFVDTPSEVNSGQSFVVKWQVTGPAGTAGQDTQLKLSYATHKSSGGSNASSSTNSSNSFGSFTVPKVFSSTFSFGNEPGQLHLTATANVGGQTLTTTKVIELH